MSGDWITVTGVLLNVRLDDDGIVALVRADEGKLVNALFHESSPEFVTLIEQNTVVTIRGEIQSGNEAGITLINCELGEEL
jgi:tRNA_anti-like